MNEWRALANCKGVNPAVFFPKAHDPSHARQARKICAACDVQAECLEFALVNRECFGIWGGLSERQRRTMRKDRRMLVA